MIIRGKRMYVSSAVDADRMSTADREEKEDRVMLVRLGVGVVRRGAGDDEDAALDATGVEVEMAAGVGRGCSIPYE